MAQLVDREIIDRRIAVLGMTILGLTIGYFISRRGRDTLEITILGGLFGLGSGLVSQFKTARKITERDGLNVKTTTIQGK